MSGGGPAIAWAEEFEWRPGKGMEVDEEAWAVPWHITPDTVEGFTITNIPALTTTSMLLVQPDRQAEELRLLVLKKLGLSADADDDTVNAAWLKRFTVAGEASQAAAPPRETMNSATRRRGGGGSAGRSPGRARQQADGQDRCQPRHGLVGGGGTPRPAITPKNLSAWRNSESVRDEHGVMSIPSPFQVRFCEDQERLRSGHRPIVLTPPMRAIIARPKRLP